MDYNLIFCSKCKKYKNINNFMSELGKKFKRCDSCRNIRLCIHKIRISNCKSCIENLINNG